MSLASLVLMDINRINTILAATGLSFFLFIAANAQLAEKFVDELDQDPGCEMTAKLVEDVFREAIRERERVFIISRPGKAEDKEMGWRRLDQIENRLAIVPNKPPLVSALGKWVSKGRGALEFWVGSNPRAVVRFKKNQLLCIDTPTHSPRSKGNN